MLTYEVRVILTDRTRDASGGYVTFVALVTVLADNDTEATLTACQMAHAIRADLDPMVLGATITSCIA